MKMKRNAKSQLIMQFFTSYNVGYATSRCLQDDRVVTWVYLPRYVPELSICAHRMWIQGIYSALHCVLYRLNRFEICGMFCDQNKTIFRE